MGSLGSGEELYYSQPVQVPGLWITGLGSQYPPYSHPPEKFVEFANRFHDTERPVLKKLLRLTSNSGIEARASTLNLENGFGCQDQIPTVVDLDNWFRKSGVDLTTQACRKAIREWGGDVEDITHTIAFNSGVQSFPGYDHLVARKLGLDYGVENIFLQGVGCAGGLSIMRVAAEVASAATLMRRPARILCFACELNTPYTRHQYAEAEAATDLQNMDIAASLFSDAAAAFVLCNDLGLDGPGEAKFQLLDWERQVTPGTLHNMGAMIRVTGYTSVITRQVPELTRKAVPPLFGRCLRRYKRQTNQSHLKPEDVDWALHPGGMAIIDGVKDELDLTDDQVRATKDIYRNRGNSGSPTVLCVLDRLRSMGRGKDDICAAAFGPGLATEMAFLRRCRLDE